MGESERERERERKRERANKIMIPKYLSLHEKKVGIFFLLLSILSVIHSFLSGKKAKTIGKSI